jgi:hypothetical protein
VPPFLCSHSHPTLNPASSKPSQRKEECGAYHLTAVYGWLAGHHASRARGAHQAQEDPKSFVYRHIKGDWGDVGPDEWAENEYAVTYAERLFSVYHTRHGRKLFVVTEGNRYATLQAID